MYVESGLFLFIQMSKGKILTVGNNCGYKKLESAYESKMAVIPIKIVYNYLNSDIKGDLLHTWIIKVYSGICPKCKSKNIVKNGDMFWGCNKCEFGFWERYLPEHKRRAFTNKFELEYKVSIYVRHDTINKAIKKKKNKNDSNNGIQLSLF